MLEKSAFVKMSGKEEMCIFVGGLAWDTTEWHLEDAFCRYGKILESQPGSISVMDAMANEVVSGNVNSIFHIGDISYAMGFLVEWNYFLHLINPVASHVSYMTAIGNHER